MADEVHQEQQFDLQEYLRVLWKRKWLIIGFTAALTAAVGVGTYLQPRVYVAKVTLLAGRDNPRLLTSDPIPGERIGQRDYLKTQAAILTSRSLLQGAVKRLMKDGFTARWIRPGSRRNRRALPGEFRARAGSRPPMTLTP